ncbi:MAG: formate/nitrite transporter family protein [Armatimonadota bacterium]|nr:MAG: formate/nitrite transporter family protein [Armatimonadota bacterium]
MLRTAIDTARSLVLAGEEKARLPIGRMFLLGILAGAYIGFGAHLATTVATGEWESWGMQRFAVGAAFTVGLMLVVIAGAELFTGNNLMTVALCSRRIGMGGLLRNWLLVYVGNLVGSLVLALMIAKWSGLLAGPVGGTAIKIAVGKTSIAQIEGINHNFAFFFRGIACNWLVCLAVLMAMASKSVSGKFLGIFFPIMAFVSSGFEHCVANMYFIPAGIFAKGFAAARAACDVGAVQLAAVNWTTMWTQNMVSVTLGNIVGGGIFVGVSYFLANVCGREVAEEEAAAPARVRRVLTPEPGLVHPEPARAGEAQRGGVEGVDREGVAV